MSEHGVILPECRIEHKMFHDHLQDAPAMREKISTHEAQIITLFKFFEDVKDVKRIVMNGAFSIVVSILIATLALAVTWGRTLEKVERLDQISKRFTAEMK